MCCVSHNGDGDDHGVRQADTARAHARWRYLVALHEATDMLYDDDNADAGDDDDDDDDNSNGATGNGATGYDNVDDGNGQ